MKILTIQSNFYHKQLHLMYATKHSSPILACLPSRQNTLLAPSSAQQFIMSNKILASSQATLSLKSFVSWVLIGMG
jgi:hypothetical protein